MIKKNILSLVIALIIMILSFVSSNSFNSLPLPAIPYLDKIVHAVMYFTLMMALIIENRAVLSSPKSYFMLALIPLVFGGAIEVLQSMFTTSRTGDFFDFCANAAGIFLSVLFWIFLRRLLAKKTK